MHFSTGNGTSSKTYAQWRAQISCIVIPISVKMSPLIGGANGDVIIIGCQSRMVVIVFGGQLLPIRAAEKGTPYREFDWAGSNHMDIVFYFTAERAKWGRKVVRKNLMQCASTWQLVMHQEPPNCQ